MTTSTEGQTPPVAPDTATATGVGADATATATATGATAAEERTKRQLTVLEASADRLAALVDDLSSDQIRRQAYPREWTVAQVLSHLGSSASIANWRVDLAVAGADVDDAVQQRIWDEWNAKDPEAQAADALVADQVLLDRLASLTPEERARVRFVVGPMNLDLPGYLAFRVNEHALHSWDVAVTFDSSASVPPDAAELVFDVLPMIAGFTARPTGSDRTISVTTTAPARSLTIAHRPDGVTVTPSSEPGSGGSGGSGGSAGAGSADRSAGDTELELPAEAFVRLIYGRLDPDHTPPVTGTDPDGDLDELRHVFPGV